MVTDSYVAAYPPLPYVLMGWPTLFFSPHRAAVIGRLSSVAICAACFASAFVAVRRSSRSPLAVWGLALAITPAAMFFAAAVNPNRIEIAAAVCLAASLIELVAPREDRATAPVDRRLLVRTVLVAVLLVGARPASLLVFALIVATVSGGIATRSRLAELARDPICRWAGAVVGTAALLTFVWFVYASPLTTVVGIRQPEVSTIDIVGRSVGRLPGRAREMVGVFGWGDTPLPAWIAYGWLLLVAGVTVLAFARGRRRERWVLGALLAFNVALPTIADVPNHRDLGFIWQGYSLPFAVLVPLFASWCIARRHVEARSSTAARTTRVIRRAGGALAVFVGSAMVVAMGTSVSRVATGSMRPSIFAFVTADLYSHPRMVAATVVVAPLLYGVLLARLLTRRTAPTPTPAERA